MVIDTHAHYLPDSVVEALRRRERAPAIRTLADGEERRLMPAGHTLPFSAATYTDAEARLAFMDEAGVDRQLLSMGLLFGVHCLPAPEAVPLARSFNDALGALCRRHDRFAGLALLPMADLDAATGELERAMDEAGLIGAILPANALLDLDRAGRLRALFDCGQRRGAHFFIHPGQRPDEFAADARAGERRRPDHPIAGPALEVQHRMAEASATLLFTDFLDPYPDILVHVANLGGTLPAVIERIDHMSRMRAPAAPLPSDRARRVYVDTASLGPRAIEAAVSLFGADRVMLGTDCPIFRTDAMLAAVHEARLGEAERAALLHGNAERVLARGAAARA